MSGIKNGASSDAAVTGGALSQTPATFDKSGGAAHTAGFFERNDFMKRAKIMLGIIVFGLLLSGVTVWPAVPELKAAVRVVWGDAAPGGTLHGFVLRAIDGLETTRAAYPFMLYAHDWLAFAHIVLAILFAGAIRDPVRNVWIVQCGLVMCALVPVLAGICIPIRGIPAVWFLFDFAFAPAAALPLWIALKDIRRAERENGSRNPQF